MLKSQNIFYMIHKHFPVIFGKQMRPLPQMITDRSCLYGAVCIREVLCHLHCIAATMEQNLELMQRLGLTENIHRKSEKLQEMMEYDIMHNSDIPETVRESALFGIRVHFFLGGIINAYQRWAEGKLNCTLDQVSSQIGDMIRQTATGFLETDWMRE